MNEFVEGEIIQLILRSIIFIYTCMKDEYPFIQMSTRIQNVKHKFNVYK